MTNSKTAAWSEAQEALDQAALLHAINARLSLVLAWLESHALVYGADQQIVNLRQGISRLDDLIQQTRRHTIEAERKAREETAWDQRQ